VLTFALLWLAAFGALVAALLLLFVYFRVLGSDLGLNTWRQELMLALVTSAAQAGWSSFVEKLAPTYVRGEWIIPALICLLFYKLSHLEDWDQYEVPAVALSQMLLIVAGHQYLAGQYQFATILLGIFGTILFLIGSIIRSV
jgi:hypothetical protein